MGCQKLRFLSSVTGFHSNDRGAGDLWDSCLLATELGANAIFQCVRLWGSADPRNWYDFFGFKTSQAYVMTLAKLLYPDVSVFHSFDTVFQLREDVNGFAFSLE